MWTDVLAAAGVALLAADDDTVDLRHEQSRRRFGVTRRARSPRPSELRPPDGPAALLVAPHLTTAAQRRLRELGWSWVADTGQIHLRFPDADFDVEPTVRTSPILANPADPLARRGVGVYAVLRRLLTTPTGTRVRQIDLAASTGLTQPRVSQLLTVLTQAGLVASGDGSWRVTDPQRALDEWLAGYPGPGGTRTHWAGLDDMWSQTGQLLDALPVGSVVSGDAGADALAAWTMPQRAVIYARSLPDLTMTGLVPVTNPQEATVSVCVPRDRTVWPREPLLRQVGDRDVLVADPVQVLWDLARTGHSDAAQAVDRLHAWVVSEYFRRADSRSRT